MTTKSVSGRRRNNSECTFVANEHDADAGDDSSSGQSTRKQRNTSVPVATMNSVTAADSGSPADGLTTSSPVIGREPAYDSSRTTANKDVIVPAVFNCASKQTTDSRDNSADVNSQAARVSPSENVDETPLAEGDDGDVKKSVHSHRPVADSLNIELSESKLTHFDDSRISDHDACDLHHSPLVHEDSSHSQPVNDSSCLVDKTAFVDDSLLDSTADVDLAEAETWQNCDRNVASYRDGRSRSDNRLVQDDNCSRANNDNVSPSIEPVPVDAASEEAGVSRKRRISATRSALYRRLLSSETAGSSDPDVSCDIFDLQSLTSDDDGVDSDASDANLDSTSDHSYLVCFYLKLFEF